jgi:Flp pilus assembly protein TadG
MLRNRESGTAALLIAGSMVLLLGMAAIAIDYGAGLNERRQDQTGADLAALSGGLELALGSSTQVVVDEVLDLVNANVRVTDATQWEDCTDAEALPVTADDLALTPSTECISFDTFSHIRVRIPNQETSTTFARVLGSLSIVTSADAEVASQLFPTEGNPPPFAVLAGYGGGDVVCLRTSSAGNPPARMVGNGPGDTADRGTEPDPCDADEYDVDSEMFGLLDPYSYFDGNGEIDCKKNSNDYFIAAGIDHPLSSFIQKFGAPFAGANEVEEGDGCTGNPKSPVNGPNTIPVKSGLTAQELRCGLLTSQGGCSTVVPGPPSSGLSSPARLHQGSHVQNTYQFTGKRMDNAALWEFFTTNSAGDVTFSAAPAECNTFANAINNGFPGDWDYYDKRDALEMCLKAWSAGSYGPLFSEQLWTSSRFAFLPLLHEGSLDNSAANGPVTCPVSNNPNCVHIDDFVPVWLQTLYTKSPSADCDDVVNTGPAVNHWGLHHAGQENSCGASNGNVDRLSAFVLDCGMLPVGACSSRPGPPTPGGDLIPTLRLTK